MLPSELCEASCKGYRLEQGYLQLTDYGGDLCEGIKITLLDEPSEERWYVEQK